MENSFDVVRSNFTRDSFVCLVGGIREYCGQWCVWYDEGKIIYCHSIIHKFLP